ncbi:MAG TPA: nuclear transport factor 2 family protein [Mycobacteriales bacterium]|nr:nuclear transport factor 2 family protein [Mycobacteriales bacterium]
MRSTMTLSEQDRLAVHELISLHGHLADDRRADQLDQLLTDDAVYDLADYGMGQVTGLPALRRLFQEAPGEQPVGHHVTNVIVTAQPDGSARVRSKGLAVMANGNAGTVVYEDHVVPTAAGWRIRHRKVVAR